MENVVWCDNKRESPVYFQTERIQRCAEQFHAVSFGAARSFLIDFLSMNPNAVARIECLSLLFRINAERDEPQELDEMCVKASKLLEKAAELKLTGALYFFGVLFLLSEEPEKAQWCFSRMESFSTHQENLYAQYGHATVLHNRQQSAAALARLEALVLCDADDDFLTLVHMMRGNCLRSLSRLNDALCAYQAAQSHLPRSTTFYLKNWVFFGLGVCRARLGERELARSLFEVCLSITHPTDFKRLYGLATDEMARLDRGVDVLFDPITGDLVSNRGFLTLRKKGTLIRMLEELIRRYPNPASKEELYQSVWSGEYHPLRHDGLIYAHMQRLRQFLAVDESLANWILTDSSGYRLNPSVPVRLKEVNHAVGNVSYASSVWSRSSR